MKRMVKRVLVVMLCMTMLLGESSISVLAQELESVEVTDREETLPTASNEENTDEAASSEESSEKESEDIHTEDISIDSSEEDSASESTDEDTTEETEEIEVCDFEEVSLQATGKYTFTYKKENSGKTITITGVNVTTYGDLIIPQKLVNLPVTKIEKDAFKNRTGFVGSLTIPNTVTLIGESAFEGCSGLNGDLTIPDSVTTIGARAFYGCSGFDGSLTISNKATTIGESAFYGCTGLSGDLTIPDSVTTIGNSAFCGCSGFKGGLTISNTATTIGNSAFESCSGLTGNLTISNSVTTIGEKAFYRCSGFKGNLTISNTATSIGNYAFYSCSELTGDLLIPNSVTTIGNYAFYNCSGFKGNLTISNTATTIGEKAFYNCSGLTGDLAIPNSVTTIGSSAFNKCSGLSSVIISNSVTKLLGSTFAGCTGLTSVTIPDSVTSITSHVFDGCSGLKTINLPSKLTNISSYAFRGCGELTDITFPNSLETIGSYAFGGCSGLKSVTIPGSVKTVDRSAFNNCTGIESVTIQTTFLGEFMFSDCTGLKNVVLSDSVKDLGKHAFSGCANLTSISIPRTVTNISSYAFSGCTGLTSMTIPGTVTSIGSYAFNGCTGLKSITIPDTVVDIGEGAFYNCSSLTIITIPDKVILINDSLFYGCKGLKSITLPDAPTFLGAEAFYDCSSLTSITIPDTVTSIGSHAFAGCSSLTGITIPGTVTSIGEWAFYDCCNITNITIPDKVTTLSQYIFSGCSGLTSITIPETVTSIEAGAFSGCRGLTDIIIPDTVTSVGSGLFSGCTGLTSVRLPNSMTSIGTAMFSECSSLTSITIPDEITSVGKNAFYYCTNLKSISFPSKLQTISRYAFRGCNSLESITFPGSATVDTYAFYICYGIQKVTNNAEGDSSIDLSLIGSGKWRDNDTDEEITMVKKGCTAVRSDCITFSYSYNDEDMTAGIIGYHGDSGVIDIPESEGGYRIISIEDEAFLDFSGATAVIIPDSVSSIGESAFKGCIGLTKVEIPASMVSVADTAFDNCTALKYINNHSKTKLTLPKLYVWNELTTGKVITDIANGIAVASEYVDDTREPAYSQKANGLWVKVLSNPDSEDGKYYYTGKAVKPLVAVYNRSNELVANKDYTYTARNNINAGVATIVIKGKGNFESTEYLRLAINKVDISSDAFSADPILLMPTGRNQNPKPALKWNGKPVAANGYTYAYYFADEDGAPSGDPIAAISAAGDYVIVITGNGNFTGNRNVKLTVSDNLKEVSKLTVEKIANQSYTGEEIKPELKVWDGKTQLTIDTDYTVEYENYTDAGVATAIIKGSGNYIGSRKVTYNITGTPLVKAVVEGLPKSVIYKGCEYTVEDFDELKLFIKGDTKKGIDPIPLNNGVDYEVSYLNNKNAGTATIVFTGKKGYTGVVKKTFRITQFKATEDADNKLGVELDPSVEYVKGGVKPAVKVSFKNSDDSVSTLAENVDYTLSYSNNNAANDGSNVKKMPTVKINFKGNYSGNRSENFLITTKDFNDSDRPVVVTAPDKAFVDKAGAYRTVITVTDSDGNKLVAGKDYDATITYILKGETKHDPDIKLNAKSIVDADSVIVFTIKAKEGGSYTGTITGRYRITQAPITSANIKLKDAIYTGAAITINPKTDITSAKIGAFINLEYGSDYEIVPNSYSNNVNKGTASVVIRGIGNYGGTKKVNFNIKAKLFKWWWR